MYVIDSGTYRLRHLDQGGASSPFQNTFQEVHFQISFQGIKDPGPAVDASQSPRRGSAVWPCDSVSTCVCIRGGGRGQGKWQDRDSRTGHSRSSQSPDRELSANPTRGPGWQRTGILSSAPLLPHHLSSTTDAEGERKDRPVTPLVPSLASFLTIHLLHPFWDVDTRAESAGQ